MKAFNGNTTEKTQVLTTVQQAAAAGKINRRTSLIHVLGLEEKSVMTTDFSEVAGKLQVPEVLLHIQDAIFDVLPANRARNWYVDFLASIQPGADLTVTPWKFAVWLEKEVAALQAKLESTQAADLDPRNREASVACASKVSELVSKSAALINGTDAGAHLQSAVIFASFAFAYAVSHQTNSPERREAQHAAAVKFAEALLSLIQPQAN